MRGEHDTARRVVYCRVSTKEQVQNLSLPVQQRACLDYCDRLGVEIDRVFVEEGKLVHRQGGRYGYYHYSAPVRCKATKVRREALESDFAELLREFRPQPEYLSLFREVVLDTWQGRQKEVIDRRAALEAELRKVQSGPRPHLISFCGMAPSA